MGAPPGAELAQGRGVYGSTWRWRHQNRTGTWKDTPNHQQFDEAGILSGDGPGGDGGGAQRDIRALFRDELLNNLEVLKEIRDDRNELASPRIMSIREINDRALGRPVQPNGSADAFVPSANPVEEVERLEREVEQLSAQQPRRELPPADASE